MKKNKETGMYECSRYFANVGLLVEGEGATKEAARENLKENIATERTLGLEVVDNFNSPGSTTGVAPVQTHRSKKEVVLANRKAKAEFEYNKRMGINQKVRQPKLRKVK